MQPAWWPQQSIPVLLKTDQPCFLLLLRLLEGKIRFAFCSASLMESLSSAAGRKAEPTHDACTWVLAQLRGTPRVIPSPLSAGSDSSCWGRGAASPPQRHQPPSAAIPAALLVVEKAILLNDGGDPWDVSFAKPGSRPMVHVCTSLADCRCLPDMPCPCPIFVPPENVMAHPDDMQLKKGADCPPPFLTLTLLYSGWSPQRQVL